MGIVDHGCDVQTICTNSALGARTIPKENSPQEGGLNPGASPFHPTTSGNASMLVDGKGAVLLQAGYIPVLPTLSNS